MKAVSNGHLFLFSCDGLGVRLKYFWILSELDISILLFFNPLYVLLIGAVRSSTLVRSIRPSLSRAHAIYVTHKPQ